MENKKIHLEDIKPGDPISCIQLLERRIKSSNEHFKYIVTIHGSAAKIEPPEVYIKVETITVMNLKKENAAWIKNRSVVKKPPFTVGDTYGFKARHDVIDDAVSEGVYKIYFVVP